MLGEINNVIRNCMAGFFLPKKGLGGNVVSSRVGIYKIYKRQDKAKYLSTITALKIVHD